MCTGRVRGKELGEGSRVFMGGCLPLVAQPLFRHHGSDAVLMHTYRISVNTE